MNRRDAERAIAEVLDTLGPHGYMNRLDIGAHVFAKTGGTFLASVLGDMLNRGLITRPVPDPGRYCQRYRLTDYGRDSLALARALERAS